MTRKIDEADLVLLQRGMVRMNDANSIMRFLSEHFRDKYGLTPNHQVTPTGEIIEVSLPDDTITFSDGALPPQVGVPY